MQTKRCYLYLLILCVLLGLAAGCGLDIDWPWEWDESCYDCRSFCEGTQGAEEDNCLAACSECQGYQECFEALEGAFEGMLNAQSEWTKVDCDDVESSP